MYNLGDAVGYIKLNIENFTASVKKVKEETNTMQEQLDGLGDVFSKVGEVAAAAFTAIATASAAGLAKAVQVGSDFEASMSQVAATMGMTADEISGSSEEFTALKAAAQEMGETTKYTASQAAEALNYLALAGYDAEESISSLPTVLNLAAAGGMDLADASDMLTDAVSALGLGLEDMESFADQMAKTAQSSNTSVSQLGDAILQIGGTAKSLAGGTTELNTALGVLANNGIKAAEGGTALRQIILNLTAPTDTAKQYMEELGLEVSDLEGNVRPLNEIFADLDEILQSKGITGSAERMEALSEIFDARQLKSAEALLANYGDTWDDLYDKIDNADGAASNMAETMSTNLQGSVTILGSALEGLGITFYDVFQKDLTDAVNSATAQVGNLTTALKSSEMQDSLQKIADSFADLIVNITSFVSDLIPKLVSGLSYIIDNFDTIKSVVAGATVAIAGAAAGVGIYTIQTNAMAAALVTTKIAQLAANAAMLANPYTAIAVALGVLVAAVVKYVEKIKGVKETIEEQNSAYEEQANEIQSIKNEYDEAIAASEEAKNAYSEEKDEIDRLKAVIDANVDSTGKIVSNYQATKDAIDQLNQILPTQIEYTDNQITSYDNLSQSIEEYNKQLIAKAELEGRTEEYQAALKANQEATEKQNELAQSLAETAEKYKEVQQVVKDYDLGYINEEYEELGQQAGVTGAKYAELLLQTTKDTLDNLTDAYQENTQILSDTEQVMMDYTKDYIGLVQDTGEEVEGIYTSEEEAIRAANEAWAAEMEEKNRSHHETIVEDTEDAADDVLTAEEELKAALEQLEIQFNTGIITDEKSYHDQRLALLKSFTGEHTTTTAKWLKTELDYQDDYNEELQKAQEDEVAAREKAAKEAKEAEETKTKNLITEYDRRKEWDTTYTDEKYLYDLETCLATLDKESDLYKDLYYKIQKYKKDLLDQQLEDEYDAIQERKKINDDYTDEQYLEDLKAFAYTLDKKSDLYKKVVKEIQETEASLKEKQEQLLQDQLNDEYDAIQERKKLNSDYTEEQYLADLQAFAAKLDKESDLYKQVVKEINETTATIKDQQQDAANTAFEAWEDGFDSLVSEAESAYQAIEDKQKSLENTLNNQIELYETKTKQVKNATTGLMEDVEYKDFSTNYLLEQTKALEDYEKSLENLKARGISDDLMQYIVGLDPDEAQEYIAAFSKMSDAELKAYDNAYAGLKQKNKEFSEKYYADEVEAFKTEWGDKITAYIESLPEEAQAAAKEYIESFISGLSDSTDSATGAMKSIFEGATDAVNKLVLTGSFENYGKNMVSSIIDGVASLGDEMQEVGKTSGNSLLNGFKSIGTKLINWASTVSNSMAETFSKSLQVTSDIQAATSVTPINQTQTATAISADNSQQLVVDEIQKINEKMLTKSDVANAITHAMPSGDVVLNIDSITFGKISRSSLNKLASSTGSLNLNV